MIPRASFPLFAALLLACPLGQGGVVQAQQPALPDSAPDKGLEAGDIAPAPTPTPVAEGKDFKDPGAMPEETQREAHVTDRAGNQLPLDTVFDAEDGSKVRLGDLFKPGRPVLLQFAYYKCASLCTVTLNGMVEVLKAMELEAGKDFEVITVSINPQETPNLARDKKASYMQELGRPETYAPWHFLSGSPAQIEALTDAAGFGYRFDTETREYAHGAAIFVVTPDGVVSRTIFGAMYEAKTVRLSLVEAADGTIGTPLDRVYLYCYLYDPGTGEYSAAIMNIVRLVSLVSILLMGIMIGTFFWKERQEARRLADESKTPTRPPEAAGDLNPTSRSPEAASANGGDA